MATFMDGHRRTWTLDITLGWLDGVLIQHGLDLHGPDWSSQLVAFMRAELNAKSLGLATLIYSLVIDQAEARGIDTAEMLDILAESGEAMTAALLAEMERATGHPPAAAVRDLLLGGEG